jgi:RNA polymerase sigma-70 factor, ECF subfamily
MTEAGALLPAIAEARALFLGLVADVRPELHRYCARMTGSVIDAEDIVQDTLAKAHFALGEMTEPPPLRPWLFRIAHNNAMDFLRRYERKNVTLVAEVPETTRAEPEEIDPALLESAIGVFLTLPPTQRSALVLKDVLGHSLEQAASTMGTTIPAVKAALVRARANLRASASAETTRGTDARPIPDRENLQRYADLFNARDWDGLRALLGEESRLELLSRASRRGPAVAEYYARYAESADGESLRMVVGRLDGLPALGVFRPADAPRPAYFILLEWTEDRVTLIRDFRYVPYIGDEARFEEA